MRCCVLPLVLFLVSLSPDRALDLPEPPDGFSWRAVPAIHGAFLVPSGWHFREEKAQGTLAYFITEEEIAPPAKFAVGATINVFLGNQSAPEQIEEHLRAQAEHYSVELVPGAFGPFLTLQCQHDIAETAEHGPIRVFHLGIVNSKTNASYLLTFESPVGQWPEAWSKGKVILKTLALDGDT
jgi:hypothetical protein